MIISSEQNNWWRRDYCLRFSEVGESRNIVCEYGCQYDPRCELDSKNRKSNTEKSGYIVDDAAIMS